MPAQPGTTQTLARERPFPRYNLLDVAVDAPTQPELHAWLAESIRRHEKHLVLNVNVHCMNLCAREAWLKDFLNSASLVFCDGAGVIWGAKLLGHVIPTRITYADWMWALAAFCAEQGFSLFFLGARPGIAAAAADKLKAQFPGLKIAGIENGYYAAEGKSDADIIRAINATRPDFLVMGMGMPKQEAWLKAHWSGVDARIALTGGACFDFVSGHVPRCPRWMADHSLEWLYRFYIEPRRMFSRYMLGNPLFFLRILRQRLTASLRPAAR